MLLVKWKLCARVYLCIKAAHKHVDEIDPRWQFGIFLAVTSGLLFTANNFLIQYFRIEALEILLVRSIVQVFVLGLTVVGLRERDHRLSGSRDVSQPPMTATVRIYVILQALVGAVKLYLNFACLVSI